MKKAIIYHNPRCSKSREALSILEDKNVDYEIINYILHPIEEKELATILKLLKSAASELIRKNDKLFKENYGSARNLVEKDYIKILLENPSLMQRPIVVFNNKAIIGRPPELILKIIE